MSDVWKIIQEKEEIAKHMPKKAQACFGSQSNIYKKKS